MLPRIPTDNPTPNHEDLGDCCRTVGECEDDLPSGTEAPALTPLACSHLPPAGTTDPQRVEEGWLTETVLTLARGIAAEVAFDRLPILADALEDAGCDHLPLLNHLRYDEPHRVHCWALRRLLRTTLVLPGGVAMAFAWCPPGSFLMGSPETEAHRQDEEIQHEVRLTRGFYAVVHPVTQAEWKAVMDTDRCRFKGAKLPVENVSWEDAQAFCRKVRELTGKAVRLPTEAEWEYAARGGTTTPFYWGGELNGTQANCIGTYPYGTEATGPDLEATSPVGSYAAEFPHPWGLADVIGNVWEWCADWYDPEFYSRSPKVDPECHSGRHINRVLRGGSLNADAENCRAASGYGADPGAIGDSLGFRVVFSLD